jgi:photosynthetic reaction center cytochrome c subunit
MSDRPRPMSPNSADPRATAQLVSLVVAGALALGSILMVGWIWDRARAREALVNPPVQSSVYVNYDPAGAYQQTAEWTEAQAAYQTYATANPQPKNVQVLTGWNTAQIYGYMVSQVSGGLKVNCQYCHNINDYSDDSNANKVRARAMMAMSGDLNRNYISKLPASVGNYEVTCATCHNGQPQFETYPVKIQNTLPNDFKLPLDRTYPGGLKVTGRTDIGLDSVQTNQYSMYHMNVSLGQGCTFCHNSRYFPSYEVEQKSHALVMLLMAKDMNAKYVLDTGDPAARIMVGKTPSCWMCHQGARVPPGAAREGQAPPMLSPSSAAPAAAPAAEPAGVAGPSIGSPAEGATVPAGELTLTGTGAPGTQLEILDGRTVIGTVAVGDDGNWSYALTPEPGVITYNVREAGSTEAASKVRVRIAAAPDVPVILSPEEGAQLAVGTITLAGTGKVGDTIEILNGDQVLGETAVGDDGRWTVDVEIADNVFASLGVRVVGTEDIIVRPIRVTVGSGAVGVCTELAANCPAWVTRQGGLRLRLRDGASASATVLDALPIGTQVSLTGEPTTADNFTWWPVRTQGGREGFMAGEYLLPDPD